MNLTRYYTGKTERWANEPRQDVAEVPLSSEDPKGYIPSNGLIKAANVALILNRPLLITGEAGVGKSAFADNLAGEMGWGKAIKFPVTSNTTANDLFFHYDQLQEFQDANRKDFQINSPFDRLRYLRWQALGEAILYSNHYQNVQNLWPHGEPTFPGPRRSVVLIDEIDKAERDVPNDILNQIEELSFHIPQLPDVSQKGHPGYRLTANREFSPVVILTSNSEKNLPDAFLRRCIYFDLQLEVEKLPEIVAKRIEGIKSDSQLLKDALDFFKILRQSNNQLRKAPATAEFLNWLYYLREVGCGPNDRLKVTTMESVLTTSLACLVKNKEDTSAANKLLIAWLKGG
ncbi:MAG: MoxR family ATPase [Magnetococcales bacterium]|nr:MoxR family ATPase [Magnetococcales bacterium]